MKKLFFIISLILVFVLAVGCTKSNPPSSGKATSIWQNSKSDTRTATLGPLSIETSRSVYSGVNIERMNHSITDANGQILAYIYFDKPVFSSDSGGTNKINTYFKQQYQNWLNGRSDRINFDTTGYMKYFLSCVQGTKDAYGNTALAKSPLKYSVDSSVIFKNEEIVSIRQTIHSFPGGPSATDYVGSTFDLQTGKMLPFTHFFKVNADAFRKELANFLNSNPKVFSFDSNETIAQFFGPNIKHDFAYDYYGQLGHFDYDYYYDGSSILITLNQGQTSYLVKWNGKTGADCKMSFG